VTFYFFFLHKGVKGGSSQRRLAGIEKAGKNTRPPDFYRGGCAQIKNPSPNFFNERFIDF
jgi:hypothetical protein